MIKKILPILICVTLCCGTAIAQSTSADEKAMWDIGKIIDDSPGDNAAIMGACQAFIKKSPRDKFAPVAGTILAWNYLKTGKKDIARKLFAPFAERRTSTLNKGCSDMARTWLTRLDRELVMASLNLVYHQNIEYPEKLLVINSLPAEQRGPLTDRWKKPWDYKLVGYKHFAKLGKGQKFQLQSKRLGRASDLATALEAGYADNIKLKPVRMQISTPGRESIEFETTDGKNQKMTISYGNASEGITLAYVGKKILLLTDGNHWKVTARPAR